jgi:hypothetical protein
VIITVSDLFDVLEEAELLPPAKIQPNNAPKPAPDLLLDWVSLEIRS